MSDRRHGPRAGSYPPSSLAPPPECATGWSSKFYDRRCVDSRIPICRNGSGSLVESDKADILARTVAAIDAGDLDQGRQILRSEYPLSPVVKNSRQDTERQCLRVFYRDGFLDRYSSTKLVHPAALRTLSLILPETCGVRIVALGGDDTAILDATGIKRERD